MTSAEAAIRPFRISDLPRLQESRAAAFGPVFASPEVLLGDGFAPVALAGAEEEQAALVGRLCAPGSGRETLVAKVDGQGVGFVTLATGGRPIGEIGLNAVHPSHAGRGIATPPTRRRASPTPSPR